MMAGMSCGKCGTAEREEGQRWCPACQAEYMRQYRRLTRAREVRAARLAGAEEFRAAAVAAFRRLGESGTNGYAVARILADLSY